MTKQYHPPTCPVCGATLPHNNPMAREYHERRIREQQDTSLRARERRSFDKALADSLAQEQGKKEEKL